MKLSDLKIWNYQTSLFTKECSFQIIGLVNKYNLPSSVEFNLSSLIVPSSECLKETNWVRTIFRTMFYFLPASALRTVQGRKIFQCPRTILRTIPIVTFAYHFLWSQQCHNNREGLYLFQKEILFAVLGFQPQDRVVRQRAWARACTGAIFSLGALFISHSLA